MTNYETNLYMNLQMYAVHVVTSSHLWPNVCD